MNRPAKVASKEAPRYVGKLCVKCVGKFNKRSSILECFKCDSMTHKVCPKSRQDKIPKTIKDIMTDHPTTDRPTTDHPTVVLLFA